MANFCQQVLKQVGFYIQIFTERDEDQSLR